MNETIFTLQIRPIKIITKYQSKRLKFTLTWNLKIPRLTPTGELIDYEELGQELTGCMAICNKDNEIQWMPPAARTGNNFANVVYNTPDLYKRVQEAISRTKYKEELNYVKKGIELLDVEGEDLYPSSEFPRSINA